MHSDAASAIESPLTVLTHIAASLDALSCAAILIGRNGIIAHANCRFCETVHRSRESLVGSDLVACIRRVMLRRWLRGWVNGLASFARRNFSCRCRAGGDYL